MYLIEHTHITRKHKEKHYMLFDDYNEFSNFAIKLSMCSNVENVQCFEVEFKKKEIVQTISNIVKPVASLSMVRKTFIGFKE